MRPNRAPLISVFLLLSLFQYGYAWNLPFQLPTPASYLGQRNDSRIERRADIRTEMSTCGYIDGDPKRFRTAALGFNCRVDTVNGLWGFCPTTVISARDCGLAGGCFDNYSCSRGCGNSNPTLSLTTFTCGSKDYCSTALLTAGVDQTYSYIACGGSPKTDHYLISPKDVATPTSRRGDPTASATTTLPTQSTSSATSALPTQSPSAPYISSTTVSGNSTGELSSNNIGAIIGGVIGGLALLCISGIVAIFLLRKDRHKRRRSPSLSETRETHPEMVLDQGRKDHHTTGGWGPQELQGSHYGGSSGPPEELPS